MKETIINPDLFFKTVKNNVKPEKCLFCGERRKIANSHSVPRRILKSITNDGWVLGYDTLINPSDRTSRGEGLNKSGTFWMICKACDNAFFKHYESMPDEVPDEPSDQLMAEIALKDNVFHLSETIAEREAYRLLIEENPHDDFLVARKRVLDLDFETFSRATERYRRMVQEGVKRGTFKILLWTRLTFKTQLAAQSQIPLALDMEGRKINDNFDYRHRTQSMHIAVFPLHDETIVLAFYDKLDKKYQALHKQMTTKSLEDNLEFINYVIFEYTSNVFLSKSAFEIIKTNRSLQVTAAENNGLPNLGQDIYTWDDLEIMKQLYQGPNLTNLPNFLSSKYI